MHSSRRRKRISPSFVLTLVGAGSMLMACQGKTQPETIVPEPPPKTKPVASTAEPAPTVAKATRKRVRTQPRSFPKNANGPVPFGELKGQNPVDPAQGSTVYVGDDDICYVRVPMNPMPTLAPGQEGMNHVPVDCPASMDAPAWDNCAHSTLYAPIPTAKAKDCYCAPTGGNPPPPPMIVACPKP